MNQKMFSPVTIGALLLAGCLLGGVQAAQAGRGHDFGRGDGFCGNGPEGDFGGPGTIPAELGLSDKQTEQIRSARTEGRKQAIPLQAELKTLHLDLREAMAADSPSERAIMEYADKISGVHGKLLKNRLQTELAVHSLLTPKQRKEWEKIRSQRHHGKGRDGKKGPQGTRPR